MKEGLSGLDHVELERRRQEALNALAEVDEELDRRRRHGRLVTRATELEWVTHGTFGETAMPHHGTRVARVVSPEQGFNVYGFRAFLGEVAPGSREGADHAHGEAVKYYLAGKGQEVIEGKTVAVGPGDTAFIPANTWHGTVNIGDEPLRFFAVFQIPGTPLPAPVYMRVTR